jgi:ClpX C4-type zinc finger
MEAFVYSEEVQNMNRCTLCHQVQGTMHPTTEVIIRSMIVSLSQQGAVDAFICSECVALCVSILARNDVKPRGFVEERMEAHS